MKLYIQFCKKINVLLYEDITSFCKWLRAVTSLHSICRNCFQRKFSIICLINSRACLNKIVYTSQCWAAVSAIQVTDAGLLCNKDIKKSIAFASFLEIRYNIMMKIKAASLSSIFFHVSLAECSFAYVPPPDNHLLFSPPENDIAQQYVCYMLIPFVTVRV